MAAEALPGDLGELPSAVERAPRGLRDVPGLVEAVGRGPGGGLRGQRRGGDFAAAERRRCWAGPASCTTPPPTRSATRWSARTAPARRGWTASTSRTPRSSCGARPSRPAAWPWRSSGAPKQEITVMKFRAGRNRRWRRAHRGGRGGSGSHRLPYLGRSRSQRPGRRRAGPRQPPFAPLGKVGGASAGLRGTGWAQGRADFEITGGRRFFPPGIQAERREAAASCCSGKPLRGR